MNTAFDRLLGAIKNYVMYKTKRTLHEPINQTEFTDLIFIADLSDKFVIMLSTGCSLFICDLFRGDIYLLV